LQGKIQLLNKSIMSEKTLVVFNATVNPEGKEAFAAYLAGAQPMTAAAGGVAVGSYAVMGKIAGENTPQMFMIVEFPSAQAVHALYDSAEYQALIPFRDQAFTQMEIFAVKER
jgi:uncharacterized protein (DUF1330 family)